jgi:2-polyprenyl-3-methyl-5-hydroxy-6-metoxy-1,4-benzoquinol methylase
MNPYDETAHTWNKLAEQYQEKFMDLDIYNETYRILCNSLPKEASILEIGCGPGNITKYLLSERPDLNILGTDVAPNMIQLAKKNNPAAHFDILDCRDISSIKKTFDGIVCGFVLPYLSPADCSQLLANCYSLLNENGILYISFVEGDPAKSGFVTGSSGDRSFFYFHTLTNISTQLQTQHFATPQIFHVAYHRSSSVSEMHTILITTTM